MPIMASAIVVRSSHRCISSVPGMLFHPRRCPRGLQTICLWRSLAGRSLPPERTPPPAHPPSCVAGLALVSRQDSDNRRSRARSRSLGPRGKAAPINYTLRKVTIRHPADNSVRARLGLCCSPAEGNCRSWCWPGGNESVMAVGAGAGPVTA